MATTPTRPAYYAVSVAELNQFYDGFLNNGKVCLLSAHPDGYLDWSRAHILDLNNPYCVSILFILKETLKLFSDCDFHVFS